jgi:hypothetical protein
MTRRKPTIIHLIPLVLMLVAGPLHAQTMFVCAMMNTVMEDRCCDDLTSRGTPETGSDPCCEQSVELRFDPASDETSVVIKQIKVRSDVVRRWPAYSKRLSVCRSAALLRSFPSASTAVLKTAEQTPTPLPSACESRHITS